MSRFYDEAQEDHLHAYVAGELDRTSDDLNGYPYELEAGALRWRVRWIDEAPPGVAASGSPGELWSDISPRHEPDGPDE